MIMEKDLKYCPVCRDEYRAEITHCAACAEVLIFGADLMTSSTSLKSRPRTPADITERDILAPLQMGKLLDVKRLKSVLMKSGIPSVIIREENCGGGCCGPDMVLQVRMEDLETAQELLHREHLSSTGLKAEDLEHGEVRVDPDGGFTKCPACGGRFLPQGPACPDCGLHLF